MSDRKYLKKNPFQMNSFPSTRQPSGASNLRSIHSQISNAVVDYSPWMRQQRRSQKSAATTTTATNIATLPRKINFNRLFSHEMKQFSCRLALHEERKCSGRCRHLRKQPTPERFAPENPAKIQWLTLELHSNSFFFHNPSDLHCCSSCCLQCIVREFKHLFNENMNWKRTIENFVNRYPISNIPLTTPLQRIYVDSINIKYERMSVQNRSND